MTKFDICIAVNKRAYAHSMVEADSPEEALAKVRQMARDEDHEWVFDEGEIFGDYTLIDLTSDKVHFEDMELE